jgi:hypothetical protein
MRSLFLFLPLALLCMAGGAQAQEKTGAAGAAFVGAPAPSFAPGRLALGGAAENLVLNGAGALSFGLAPAKVTIFAVPDANAQSAPMAGYLAWDGGSYRLDANLRRLAFGGVVAGMGAEAGVPFGETGTSYGIRVNASLLGERFSVNPASRIGLVDPDGANPDLNLVVTVNHAITPSLSLIGQAEARRGAPGQNDSASPRELLLGAGLGLRF